MAQLSRSQRKELWQDRKKALFSERLDGGSVLSTREHFCRVLLQLETTTRDNHANFTDNHIVNMHVPKRLPLYETHTSALA